MGRYILVFLIATMPTAGLLRAQTVWSWQNPVPHGNRHNDVWLHTDGNVFLVGGAGTVTRSSDLGSQWLVEHGVEGVKSMFRRVFFLNSLNGWIVADGGLVLQTSDGGSKWDIISSNAAMSPRGLVFVSQQRGWLVGGGESGGIVLKSSDGGSSWITAFTTSAILEDIFFLTDSTGWIVGADAQVYETRDAGHSWNNLTALPQCCPKSIFAHSSDTIWVAGSYVLLQSTNSGQTWDIRLHRNDTFHSITFADRNRGVAVGVGGTVASTTDGGTTWTSSEEEVWPSFLRVSLRPDSIGLAIGEKGLASRTTDNGRSWSRVTSGHGSDLFAADFVSPLEGWAGGRYGHLMHTTNGGDAWEASSDSSDQPIVAIDFVSPLRGWMVGGQRLSKTTDGGGTWQSNPPPSNSYLLDICFMDSLTGWLSGESGTILKTTDGGVTWDNQGRSDFYNIPTIQFVSPSVGWALNHYYNWPPTPPDSSILRTTDGGVTWTKHNVSTETVPGDIRGFHFISENTGWACGESERIWRTDDGGITWTIQHVGNNRTAFSIYFASRTHGFAVGGGFYYGDLLLQTTNGGTTWTEQWAGNSKFLYSVWSTGRTTWVFGEGSAILRTDLDVVSVGDSPSEQQNTWFDLAQNYPNPFNSATTITYSLHRASHITISIFNTLGQHIATVFDGHRLMGTHTDQWNAHGVSSGVYLCRLQGGSKTITKKILLIK